MYAYLSEIDATDSIGIFLFITSTNWPFMGPFLICREGELKN